MTTLIKAKLKKSDGQTNIDKYIVYFYLKKVLLLKLKKCYIINETKKVHMEHE